MSFWSFEKGGQAILAAAALAAVLLLNPHPVQAHKVFVYAWVEGDKVVCDAYFSKSQKVQKCPLVVTDPSGAVVAEGQTDENGAFSFKPTRRTDLTITVKAGMGHQAQWTVKAVELPDLGGEPAPIPVAQPAPAGEKAGEPAAVATAAAPAPAEIRQAVEEALEAKLKPLAAALAGVQHSLAELKEGKDYPGLVEIVGGLGWILGIMGLVMYFRRPR
ncbi:MAG: hypothetical protein AB1896_05840 [Thermodesulfobacteriota bacterium]